MITPDIYWVVGTATNVGKTTIAAAAIRALNRMGQPALGFKPVAGVRLKDSIDLMVDNYPGARCMLFGSDAMQLARASPLTSDELLDVVVPWQLVYRVNNLDTVLLRIGSSILGNAEYFKTAQTDALARRPDFQRLAKLASLPLDRAQLFDEKTSPRNLLSPEKCGQAFDYLMTLGPAAVVCEGAGPYLPVWQGHPRANHIFLVTEDVVHFYPQVQLDVDIDLQVNLAYGLPPGIKALMPALAKSARRSVAFFMVEKDKRADVADQMVGELLAG